MPFTLIHLLIITVLSGLGMGLGYWLGAVFPFFHAMRWLPLLLAFLMVLAGTWPIFSRLQSLPMVVPACPHCHQRGEHNYWVIQYPLLLLRCQHCEQHFFVTLAYSLNDDVRQNMAEFLATNQDLQNQTVPILILRWPGFVGIYRTLEKGKTDDTNTLVG